MKQALRDAEARLAVWYRDGILLTSEEKEYFYECRRKEAEEKQQQEETKEYEAFQQRMAYVHKWAKRKGESAL